MEHTIFPDPGCNSLYTNYYNDVIMSAMTSQIIGVSIVYSTVCLKFRITVFVWRIRRSPVNSPYNAPITRKMFLFDDVIMRVCFTQKVVRCTPSKIVQITAVVWMSLAGRFLGLVSKQSGFPVWVSIIKSKTTPLYLDGPGCRLDDSLRGIGCKKGIDTLPCNAYWWQ